MTGSLVSSGQPANDRDPSNCFPFATGLDAVLTAATRADHTRKS
jgi:hypothetical protein